jgi:hypothetical protein
MYFLAIRSNAIVSSLFPSTVRDRLFPPADQTPPAPKGGGMGLMEPTKYCLKSFISGDVGKTGNPSSDAVGQPIIEGSRFSTPPIADLFIETTVLFVDISGFTSWSSLREPAEVFTLLENIYGAFNAIAVKRGVFKVETIGVSYVAITGLPEPRKDPAICMVKFARNCCNQFLTLLRKLEVTLGPGTEKLQWSRDG